MRELFLVLIVCFTLLAVACSSIQGTDQLARDLDIILEQQQLNSQATR